MTLIVILTGVRSGSFGNLRSAISASPRPTDHNVFVDDDAQRPARPDAHSRLDIEIAGDELVARPRTALLGGFGATPRRGAPDRHRRDPGRAAAAARPDRARRARLSHVRPPGSIGRASWRA